MKRWHIEGIVNVADASRNKLVIPKIDNQLSLLSGYRSRVCRESILLSGLRKLIGGLLHYL
jgi:hypothetical protein